MIHFPLAASENFKGKSKQGLIGDTIEEIDWSVGEILTTIKELGIDDKTLVIFTSDNGPAGRAAPPFRGNKGTIYEGGVREPCIMRWPGKIPAGTTCEEIIGNIDMLPTFAKLAGAEPPSDRVIDGRDFSPLMFDPKSGPVRDTHLYFGFEYHGPSTLDAIRQGDWKLFVRPQRKESKVDFKPALYNLADDPGESKNVASEHPDIVERLAAEARRREAEIQEHQRPPGRSGPVK
jgi:arylsulfatase A-like enzyme